MWEELDVELCGVPERVSVDWAAFQETVSSLAIERRVAESRAAKRRLVVGVFGPPASGKSLFSALLSHFLSGKLMRATTVSADAFHFPNAELKKRGLRARKGMPETMDLQSLASAVSALKSGRSKVRLPVYCRRIHDVLKDAVEVAAVGADNAPEVVITEGLFVGHCSALRQLLDVSVYCESRLQTSRRRLLKRKTGCGVPEKRAIRTFQTVDVATAAIARGTKHFADVVVATDVATLQPMAGRSSDSVTRVQYTSKLSKSVVSGSKDGSEDKAIADTKAALGLPKNVSADGSGARKRRTKHRAVRSAKGGKSQKSKATRRRTQRRTAAIESVLCSLLEPNSEVVYFLANAAIAVLLFILLVLCLIRPNIHFVIMTLLALGLLFSFNFVWTHRIRQPKVRKLKKKKSGKAQKRTRKDATLEGIKDA